MLIKKLFGNHSRFVLFSKFFLIALTIVIVLYVFLVVKLTDNKGKVRLQNNNKQESSRPSLAVLNSKIEGIKFNKYNYEVLTDEIEKDNQSRYFLYNIDGKIFSSSFSFKLTSDLGIYDEVHENAQLKTNVKLYHAQHQAKSEYIYFNFMDDYISSEVKFEAFSELYHFESLKGFKTDKIDFSVIEFFGPIFINFKQKQSTLKSQSMNLFLDKKSKEIDRAIFNENIQFHNAKFDIKSDKATYFANKNQLIFEENLVVTSNGKRLNGSLFIYDINKDIGHIEAGKKTNNKVEIFFNDTNNKK